MSEKPVFMPSDAVPLRAPRRWFACIEYAAALKIELPQPDEATAIAVGIAHLDKGQPGIIKIGYYGFRSRVILYTEAELTVLRAL